MNIQDGIGKIFGYIEIAYSMGVNAYFGPRQKIDHMQHLTTDPENLGLKLIITGRHIDLQKKFLTLGKTGKSRSRSNLFL